ncbi:uncharacterized protein LOC144435807 [Glandiceps talaboti]
MTSNKTILLLLIPLVIAALVLPVGISLSFMNLKNKIFRGLGIVLLTVGAGSIIFLIFSFVYLKRYKLKSSNAQAYAYDQRRKSSDNLTYADDTSIPMLDMKPHTGIVDDDIKFKGSQGDFEPLPVFKLQPVPPGKKKGRVQIEVDNVNEEESKTLITETSKPTKVQRNNNDYIKINGVGNWKHVDNVKRLSQEGGYDTKKGWVHVNNVEGRPQLPKKSDWIHIDNVNYKRISQLKRVSTYAGEERKKREAKVKYNRSESV